ncbi:MAG: glucokinase [Ottowia sp.]
MTQWALIGDIGGTHARFALTDLAAAEPRFEHERTLDDADYGSLAGAALDFLQTTSARPSLAALAVAGPADGEQISLTNHAWSFRRDALRRQLGVDTLLLVNDFTAIAWAAPQLAQSDRVPLQGPVRIPPEAPVTLVGAGTGLGVGLLVQPPAQRWQVIATEGGHAGFAPTDDEERAIGDWLATRYGRVSNERLLSGRGLSHIDAALRGLKPAAAPAPQQGERDAKDIVDAALQGTDVHARRALARFCRIYGAVAGDAALMHGARTVLIAGGMVLHFAEFFRNSGFMDAFVAKGRHTRYMKSMAVQVIVHANPGLLGAAVALRERHAQHGAGGARQATQTLGRHDNRAHDG